MDDPGLPAEDVVRAVARRYSAHADAYRKLWAPELLPLASRLVSSMDLGPARRVLDLGAGVGALFATEREAAPDAAIVLADRAEGMLRLAPEEALRTVVDARALPFPDRSFDAVIMAFMLFHVPRPERALVEARRVLRPGGTLGLATWGESRPRAAIEAWTRELDAHGAPEDPVLADHDQMDDEEKVRSLLAGAGFDVRSIETVRPEHPVTLEEFIELRTRLGPASRRLAALDADRRASCLERAIARVSAMEPREYVDDTDAILSVARAAAG